jgi:hypothetical protein
MYAMPKELLGAEITPSSRCSIATPFADYPAAQRQEPR